MLIVGLGNPGQQYEDTPHNLGFVVLDQLARNLDVPDWKTERQVQFQTFQGHWLIKPHAFMNTSGSALNDFCRYKKITIRLDQLWVVHDEIDLPAGTLKPDFNRSSAGHQGVQSIIDELGSQAFHRLRIGIGSNRELLTPVTAEHYVLQPMSQDKHALIQPAIKHAVDFLKRALLPQI